MRMCVYEIENEKWEVYCCSSSCLRSLPDVSSERSLSNLSSEKSLKFVIVVLVVWVCERILWELVYYSMLSTFQKLPSFLFVVMALRCHCMPKKGSWNIPKQEISRLTFKPIQNFAAVRVCEGAAVRVMWCG